VRIEEYRKAQPHLQADELSSSLDTVSAMRSVSRWPHRSRVAAGRSGCRTAEAGPTAGMGGRTGASTSAMNSAARILADRGTLACPSMGSARISPKMRRKGHRNAAIQADH
jgi:hypothetical protein